MVERRQTKANLFQSTPLLLPAVAFIAGIIVGDRWGDPSVWWIALAVTVAVIFCMHRWASLQSLAILLTMAVLGGVCSSMQRQHHDSVAWPDVFFRYEAVVVSETAERPKTVGMDVVIIGQHKKLKCYIEKDERSRRLCIGDRLQICSRIERNNEWHHGTFDYRRYLEVHGFSGHAFVRAHNWQMKSRSWDGLSVWERTKLHFLCYRHQLLERYRQSGMEEEQYAVLAAMTLGDKSAMKQELKDVYAVSGASHVLALSGLHLGIIYMLLSLVVGRKRRLVSQIIIVLGIWAFALLTGLSTSIIRSALMITTYALLSLTNRSRMSLNALSLTAIVILLLSPDSLFDVGFQMSFAAMLAILLIKPHFEMIVPCEYLYDRPIWKWSWDLATVSVSAQIGVAPLIAYYFGRFSTWFLLTNFVAVPAAMIILYLALLSVFWPLMIVALVHVVGWLNSSLSYIASLPYASIEGLHPSALHTAMVYVIIVSLLLILIRYDKRS